MCIVRVCAVFYEVNSVLNDGGDFNATTLRACLLWRGRLRRAALKQRQNNLIRRRKDAKKNPEAELTTEAQRHGEAELEVG